MADLVPINFEEFKSYSWRKADSLKFASGNTVCILGAQELIKASVCLPIAFVSVDERFLPVALQGVAESQNLFINDKGKWVGRYLPEFYRHYPFVLVKNSEGSYSLCFDKSSECILPAGEGEPFFDETGELDAKVKEHVEALQKVERDRVYAVEICNTLSEHNLLEPWKLEVDNESGKTRLEGIFRVSEEKLNQLDGSILAGLRDSGVLIAAYAQMLSMQNVHLLGTLAFQREKLSKSSKPSTAEYIRDSGSGTLSFENI